MWALRGLGRAWRGAGALRGFSCWSCGRPFPPLSAAAPPRFCPACQALQPPDAAADLFRLLGCPRTFRLDEAELQQRFRSLQRRLHPDLFSRRPQTEQGFSEQHSALVNTAYSTLRTPLSRGLYQLELNGVELEKGTDCEADPEFLSEIMEINEKLTETNNEDATEEMESYIAAKQEELAKDVGQAFDQDDFQKAKKILAKMKYFANLEEKVKKKKLPS
ncbi:iron-sulfur cluster co-chaperone protein HscB [Heteronotia binoei]|uniref:iron-sulfur cluster co-chaperone protein HscB n=1 Tax=Heteronotia binoei TaxID=13085 RepID=UPI00292DA63E|nr:iron-sulfur cluster co-chaperone protein HscB [Heteronotia binoei]